MAFDLPNSVRKVANHLRATGDAPILKQAKFKISGTDKFAKVIDFLCHQLHKETLFVYVNSAFSPNPDQLVIDLYDCQYIPMSFQESITAKTMNICSSLEKTPGVSDFGFDGKLVVNYACSMAWG